MIKLAFGADTMKITYGPFVYPAMRMTMPLIARTASSRERTRTRDFPPYRGLWFAVSGLIPELEVVGGGVYDKPEVHWWETGVSSPVRGFEGIALHPAHVRPYDIFVVLGIFFHEIS